jgi:hypothetical protein
MTALSAIASPMATNVASAAATTPHWVPLAIAGLGVLGTLGAALLTQRRSDRRERGAWTREREREREHWAREDAVRTFDQRRDSTVDFYESVREMAFLAYNHGMGLNESAEVLAEGWQLPTYRRLQHLRVFGSPEVVEAANEAYSAAWSWGHGATFGVDDDEFYDGQDRYDQSEAILLDAIRLDLGVDVVDQPPSAEPEP